MSTDFTARPAGPGAPGKPAKRPRMGLRDELIFVLPAALLLLVVLSTFTLFSYRGALLRFREERQQDAERLARGVADRLLAGGAARGPAASGAAPTLAPSADRLRLLAPGARGVRLFDAHCTPVVTAGASRRPAAAAGAGRPRRRPVRRSWHAGGDRRRVAAAGHARGGAVRGPG